MQMQVLGVINGAFFPSVLKPTIADLKPGIRRVVTQKVLTHFFLAEEIYFFHVNTLIYTSHTKM